MNSGIAQVAMMFMIFGVVLVAPHLSETEAKGMALLCVVFAASFSVGGLWPK